VGHHHRRLVGGLEVGLVPAREDASGVSRLALRGCQCVLVSVSVSV
jgi:hypothetical protein